MTMTLKNELVEMRKELNWSLRNLEEHHYHMVIDQRKCIGCDACTIACKAENVTPPGVAYNIVMREEIGEYPNVREKYTSRPCMQCDNPPCVPVCPVRATYKGADGIVYIDYEVCIGCRYCINACPYGARSFDYGEYYTARKEKYEKRPTYEYEKKWPRKRFKSPVGNARKCHFCIHRVNKGMLPACVTACLGRARYFGDIEDENSLVNKLIAGRKGHRLKEELGTNPSVFYLD